MLEYPGIVFGISLVTLVLAVYSGTYSARARITGKLDEDERSDLGVILTAALTLLGLIIGFTFSMAISRYDQRKNLEAAEANAIGTELARASLLPSAEAARIRELLGRYLKQRVVFYGTRNARQIQQINASTYRIQLNLWSAVVEGVPSRPAPLAALVVSGMNDVLNSQAYTQASWWNRIPITAWVMMAAIALFCAYLLGYTARRPDLRAKRLVVLPLIVAISFFLIADIDSPRGGIIRVRPQNLESVSWPSEAP